MVAVLPPAKFEFPPALVPVLDLVDKAVAGLGLNEADSVDLGELLYAVALDAWNAGINAAPQYLLSGSAAAEELGVTSGRLRQIAGPLNVGSKMRVGTSTVWLFTPDDMAVMRSRGDGRFKNRPPVVSS